MTRHRGGPPPHINKRAQPVPAGRPPAAKNAGPAATLLAAGLAHHNAGRLAEAEAAYRQVLAADPALPDSYHLLGVIALQVGNASAAADLIAQAIRRQPRAPFYSNLGTALRRLGRREEALAACREAVRLDADLIDAHNNLANVAAETGNYDEAITALRAVLARRPDMAEQKILLGRVQILAGRPEEAVITLKELLRRHSDLSDPHVNLGVALRKLNRNAEAMTVYRQGVAKAPADAALLSNLGSALDGEGRPAEGIVLFRRAMICRPDFVDAHVNMSVALRDLNRLAEAADAARSAIRLKPDSAEAHTNLGHTLLLAGDLRQGFAEYEWRFRLPDFSTPRRDFGVPEWDGGSLQGRTLLVYDEQGVGDGINFIRYLPMLKARGATIVVEVNTQLVRLFQGVEGADSVVGRFSPLPPVDYAVSMLSIPRLLATTVDNIPNAVPYLTPESALVDRWRSRLADVPGLRVGVAWAGSPQHRNDHNRSLALEALQPLSGIPGVSLYSIQKGPAAERLSQPVPGLDIVNLAPDIGDFADTAAILSQLDLLISVDTSVVHLAGALARPVWTLLPFAPDWRWLLDREDTPWYPTMRLFRQSVAGDWTSVIGRVATALAAEAAQRCP